MAREPIEMTIETVTTELPDTKTLRLKWPAGHEPDFQTGQFITVYWPDAPEYKRAYSLSSCALDRGFYDVTVKREGKMGTRVVDWAKAGNKLFVLPPAGKFLPEFTPGQELVCIAGGSGVTPFRAFARDATRRKLPNKITVLYSVRTTNDIIFEREFRELALANGNFNFYVTCTRLHPDDKWTGRRGRIDAAWVREQIHELANTTFYACGPNPLVEFAEQLVIHELGVPKAQLKMEKWG
jgi:ferredoxin-NADP reductase